VQVIVQFEDGNAQILQGCEFDLGTSRNLVEMGFEFSLDLVVVHAQARFFRRPRWDRQQNYQRQSQGTRKDAQSAPRVNPH
jgi:hypothetical protein